MQSVENLVRMAQIGETNAENALFENLSARFYSLVKFKLMNWFPQSDKTVLEEDVKDIVQNALITIQGKYKSLQFDQGFIFWANKVLRFTIGNYMSKRIRSERIMIKQSPEFDLPGNPQEDIVYAVEHHELLDLLIKNINKLDLICKKVMAVFFESGNREDVIKMFPDTPLGTIDNKIYRYRKKLKALLKKEEYAV